MTVERTFWGLHFKVKFLEAKGTEFQTLVQHILEMRYPTEFVAVKPAGQDGDWKNDGLLTTQRRMLAIYGPEGWAKKTALDKIDSDYAGAVEHWGDAFDTWVFVHNDPKGVPPYVLDRLNEHTSSTTSPHRCELWGYPALREIVFELDDDQLTALLGPPVRRADLLAIEVQDVIPMLKALEIVQTAPPDQVRPVPADKLIANGLSEDAEDLLRSGMRRSAEVAKYFDAQTNRPLFRDDLGQRFTQQYRTFRDQGLEPDEIIVALLQWVSGPVLTPRAQAAALAIVAFFFEQCDIYEAGPPQAVS